MFSKSVLEIDAPRVAAQIEEAIRQQVGQDLRRRGIVVGLSGGIDSSVVTTLAARALGPERVLALLMPERDSSAESATLGTLLTSVLSVPTLTEDICTGMLEAAGCYARQTEAIRTVFPDFSRGDRFKIIIPSILDAERLNISELTVQKPNRASRGPRACRRPPTCRLSRQRTSSSASAS